MMNLFFFLRKFRKVRVLSSESDSDTDDGLRAQASEQPSVVLPPPPKRRRISQSTSSGEFMSQGSAGCYYPY